ncbi:helix-turn-helix domain-containing protein [Pseudonocardia endophytica]|uniref:AraC family transcriptional regulator n=1 Tax=Pseudonocardia endophytica TaxID=401976 RepID=A0A4R1HX51_PSEEN|nr:helix-turn-helix domain-containing protein [Pseudonocardia endophytica]TCK26073.1 AraC family transcriptional regulator [Pseudonocardia endophytica]
MARYWTTGDRPTKEQFSYWREVVCEAFTPLAPRPPRADATVTGLPGWVRSSALTTTNCAEIASTTQLIDHGRDEVRRTDSEQIFVNLQVSGHCIGSQGGRECLVPAGSFALFDTTSEYRLRFYDSDTTREWRVVSFRVPRATIAPLVAAPHAITAVAHDATAVGLDTVLGSTMRSIWRTADTLDPAAAHAAESAFAALLAATVGGSEQLLDTRQESLDATLRSTINRYLAAHLQGPDLSAATVARRFGISVRKLHSLYAASDLTYARTVMRFRVDACATELAAGTTRSLTHLAARWGFTDLSHMNRVFRKFHDCLPSQFEGGKPVNPQQRETRA